MFPVIIVCSLYFLVSISFLSPPIQHLWKAIKSLPSPRYNMRLPPSPSPVHRRPLHMPLGSQDSPLGYNNLHSPALAGPLRLDALPTHNTLAGPLVAVIGLALGIIAISNKRNAPTSKSHDSEVMHSPDPFICLTGPHHGGIITGQGSLDTSPVQLPVSPLTNPKIARSARAMTVPTLASTFDNTSPPSPSPSYYPPSTPPRQKSTSWPPTGASTTSPSTPISSTAATPIPSPIPYESGEISPPHIPPLSPPTPENIACIDNNLKLSPTPSHATRAVRNVRGATLDRDGSSTKRVHFRDTPLFEPSEFHQPSSRKAPPMSSSNAPRDNGHTIKIAGLGFSDPSAFETGKRDDRSRHGNPASLPPRDVGQDKPDTRPSRTLDVLSASRPYTPALVGPRNEVNSSLTPRPRPPLPGRSLPPRQDNSETSERTKPPPPPRDKFNFPPRTVVLPWLTQFPAPYEHIKTPSNPEFANTDANTHTQVDAAGTIAVPPSPTLAEPCRSPRTMDWDTRLSPEDRKALVESIAAADRAQTQKTLDMFAYYESRAQDRELRRQRREQVAKERALKDQERKRDRELREQQRKQERDLRTQQRMLDRLERDFKSRQRMQTYEERGYNALEELSFMMDDA